MPAKVNTNYFIDKAKSCHGERYEYSKSEYVSGHVKVTVICSIHGEFTVTPANHYRGSGCPDCSGRKKSNTEEFIKKAKLVHGSKYTYDKTDYKNNNIKVIVSCPSHGDFEVQPINHVSSNRTGCPDCGIERAKEKLKVTTEDFIEKARAVHGDLYTYTETDYKSVNIKVKVSCSIHGNFEIAPSNHLRGRGCITCGNLNQGHSRTDFIARCKDKLGVLYLIRCYSETEDFYKVGISSNSIKQRYNNKTAMPYDYETILDIKLDAKEVYDLEKQILKDFYRFRYEPSINFGGFTECINKGNNIVEYIESRITQCYKII